MPNYRLVLPPRGKQEAQSIRFHGADAAEALLIAQRHEGPAQLWEDGRHVCTLHKSGNNGEVWIISPDKDGGGAAAAR